MAAEAWLRQGATALWACAGGPPPFPRNLNRLWRYGLQAKLCCVSRLTLSVVAEHVRQLQLPAIPAEPDRRLRGCLVVGRERPHIFLDTGDPEDEQRLTLAHEIAHLWLEVMEPRDRVREYLGERALEVLGGLRDPSAAERLHATLLHVPLRRPFHLLERDAEYGLACEWTRVAEERADRLALELLAPEDEALRRLPVAGLPFSEWLEQATATLIQEFDLPPLPAHGYARRLAPTVGARPSFWERFSS